VTCPQSLFKRNAGNPGTFYPVLKINLNDEEPISSSMEKNISSKGRTNSPKKQNHPPQKLDWKNTTPFINHFTDGTHFIYYPFFSSILNITRSHDLADRPSLKARCLCISI